MNGKNIIRNNVSWLGAVSSCESFTGGLLGADDFSKKTRRLGCGKARQRLSPREGRFATGGDEPGMIALKLMPRYNECGM